MFKILLCLLVLGTALADDDFNDRYDDSIEIHYVGESPKLKQVGVPLPFNFYKNAPLTKTATNIEPAVKTASDVEVVHVDQHVDPNAQPTPAVTAPKTDVNFRAPFFVKVDDDDDDDRAYFRTAGAAAVPLTYSSGPYRFKYDFDDDDDYKHYFRNTNPTFRRTFHFDDDDDDKRFFTGGVGVPLPTLRSYDDDTKVVFKTAANTAPKYFATGYKIDDDDDDRRVFLRRAGHPAPLPYYAYKYKYDDDDHDDLFDVDDK